MFSTQLLSAERKAREISTYMKRPKSWEKETSINMASHCRKNSLLSVLCSPNTESMDGEFCEKERKYLRLYCRKRGWNVFRFCLPNFFSAKTWTKLDLCTSPSCQRIYIHRRSRQTRRLFDTYAHTQSLLIVVVVILITHTHTLVVREWKNPPQRGLSSPVFFFNSLCK